MILNHKMVLQLYCYYMVCTLIEPQSLWNHFFVAFCGEKIEANDESISALKNDLPKLELPTSFYWTLSIGQCYTKFTFHSISPAFQSSEYIGMPSEQVNKLFWIAFTFRSFPRCILKKTAIHGSTGCSLSQATRQMTF